MAFVSKLTRRGLATSSMTAKINEFIVIGGGLMGAGIAQVNELFADFFLVIFHRFKPGF